MFSSRNDSTLTYVRNPCCWVNPIDISCIQIHGGTNGCLISPRHVMFANHYGITNPCAFVDMQGNVCSRNVIGWQQVSTSDCLVGILDSDVSSNITFAPVLSGWPGMPAALPIPGPTDPTTWYVPVFASNQFKQALIYDVFQDVLTPSIDPDIAQIQYQIPQEPQRKLFYTGLIGGDSGSPSFFIMNGKLILLTCWHWGSGAGPSYRDLFDMINVTMHNLSISVGASTNYQLTLANLSGYPLY